MDETTDDELLRRMRQGDTTALGMLYVRYAPSVRDFAARFMGEGSDTGDVTHNIFCTLWDNRQSITNIDSLKAYLFRMTRNAIFQAYRHRQVVNEYQSDFLKTNDDTTPDLESVITTADLLEMINLRIEQMPEIQRRIFRMSRYEKKTYAEIAQGTGLSTKSVQRYISLALAELRKLVEVMLVFTIFDQFDM